ncbi:MAG: NAD-dependent epimerase/dehydratase family protein [Elusimicrobiota bacterium]|nr:NAD-dependent epimerase/dehydratase family protein [Elusimicrobiota bacterium]
MKPGLSGSTVLVTGAYGFLGQGLVAALLDAGASVAAVGRDAGKARERLGERRGLRFIAGDVNEPLAYDGPADFVVHAASAAAPKRFGVDPVGVLSPNVFGTRNLLELARARKTRKFLFVSSAEVYGVVPESRQPILESEPGGVDPTALRSCYAESKRMGEALCAAWHRQHGVPAVIGRLFHTYGPGMDPDDGRVFADFTADAVAGRAITVKGDGLDRRAFCHRDDAVAGLLTLLERGVPGEAYNVANDEAECGVLELAERIQRLFPKRVPGVIKAPRPAGPAFAASPVRRSLPSTAKLRALGWAPRIGLDEGFRRTVESYL